MDPSVLIGIVIGLLGLWAVALAVSWLIRPRGVPATEIIRVVPGTVRLLRVPIAALRYARRRVGLQGLRVRWVGTDAGFAVVARLVGGRVA